MITSSKPYLIRGIYEWLLDNELTPHLVVDTDLEGVQVPQDYVEDGRITLNISPLACRGLHLDNERIVFTARFSGNSHQIALPPAAVLAIYAKENGRGMVFGKEEDEEGAPATLEPTTPPTTKAPRRGKRASLKVVK